MAISQTQRTELLTLLVGMFDAAPTSDLLSELATGLDNGATLAGYAANLGESAEFSSIYPTYLTAEEFAERFVNNLLGDNVSADAKAEGAAFVAGAINAGASRGEAVAVAIETLASVPEDDATWGQAVAELNNKVEVAEYFALNGNYSGLSLEQMRTVTDGVTAEDATVTAKTGAIDDGTLFGGSNTGDNIFELTATTDRGADFVGTSGNDLYEAFLSQNSFTGGVSNTLSSADRLDGQGGVDTLTAELVPEFFGATGDAQNRIDVQPSTQNIEIVKIQARDALTDAAGSATTLTVDAKNMTDIDKIGSNFSDGDLVIENLTTLESDGNLRNTGDLTVTMVHTDNFNSDQDASDLTVYFDEDYLVSGQTSEAQAFYFLLDEDANLANNPDLLNNINVDGIRFSLDGGATIIDLDTPEAATAGTHAGFVAALQTELAALIADGTVPAGTTLTLDPTITDFTFLDSGERSVDIPAIVLTTGDGSVVTPIGYSQVEDAIGEYDLYGRFNAQSQVSNDPISINVELEKVGRDGEGGNLIIGGKDQNSNGDTDVDQADGIEVFNISVLGNEDKPSNLGYITSTNGALRTVNIATDAAFVDGDTFAALTIRGVSAEADSVTPFGIGSTTSQDQSIDTVNANSFLGDLNIGEEFAAQNVNTLTAAGGGDVYFNVAIDEEGDYSYSTGAGSDEIRVSTDGDAIDDVNTSLTVSTAAGDDEVYLSGIAAETDVSEETMYVLDNLSVSTSSGEDYVEVTDGGRYDINTGTDSDFVFINNNGTKAVYTHGADSGVSSYRDVLYKATMTVTFAGFESTVTINTTAANKFIATDLEINDAIERAIEANPELSRLLDVTYDDGTQQITVTSTIDGNNLMDFDITQPDVVNTGATGSQVNLSTGDYTALLQGMLELGATGATTLTDYSSITSSSTATDVANIIVDDVDAVEVTDTAGTQGTLTNTSVINLAKGANDLVALGSNVDADDTNNGNSVFEETTQSLTQSTNTLVIDDTFGKVSIANFFDADDLTEVGSHVLDFTAYLNNTVDASSNTNNFSETPVDVTLNTDATAEENSVTFLSYDETTASSVSFDNLTAAQLVAALNGTGGTTVAGGLVNGDLNADANDATIVQSTQSVIVMIENNQNLGEYKVFNLVSSNTEAGDDGLFASSGSQLLGTLDFGNSIDPTIEVANLVGSADYNTAVSDFLA
ncbi:beta strand repeat-containing protein [Marinomonas gallaica]|uniref:beta strand repeat-containing protein n=1 Tax=Marinomonas gallaica TaxID=1806667 RepID=UPI00082D526E|nr:hypothetical protein [Marinomonas gallaica]